LVDTVGSEHIAGAGLGAPGAVDVAAGEVVHAADLGWEDVEIRSLVAQLLGHGWDARVWLENDTNAAALGEMMYGAGVGAAHLLFVNIGTHVNSGIILDGRIYHGASGGAGEIGHIVLDPDGEPCRCGRRGCLEMLIAGPAILRQTKKSLKHGIPSSMDNHAYGALTTVEVISAAMNGDWLARAALENAGVYLGMALAYYVNINNPEVIIIGGRVGAAAGEMLMASAREVIQARALPGNFEAVRLVSPELGGASGAIGAGALVWHKLNGGK
jgi:glucokinase